VKNGKGPGFSGLRCAPVPIKIGTKPFQSLTQNPPFKKYVGLNLTGFFATVLLKPVRFVLGFI